MNFGNIKSWIYFKLPVYVRLNITKNRYLKECDQKQYIPKTSKKKIYIIGEAYNGNLGDQAINVVEYEIIKKMIRDQYEIIEITSNEFWQYYNWLNKNIKKDDVIFLQGGGSIGDIYIETEEIRESIIYNFNHNTIIIFPQTIYWTKNYISKQLQRMSHRIYGRHRDLLICTRERYSFELAGKLYPKNERFLVPDLVLKYKPKEKMSAYNRQGILLCLRNDTESIIDQREKDIIYDLCVKNTKSARYTDTFIPELMISSLSERRKYIDSKINEFSRAKLIITDRLHGMVLAAISETPCIVISNYNYKIEGVYDWIKNLSYIVFMPHFSLEVFEKVFHELIETETVRYTLTDEVRKIYRKFENVLKKKLKISILPEKI